MGRSAITGVGNNSIPQPIVNDVLIARGEKIPDPGAKLTAEQKGLFRAIALQGGNFEIQKMNVGIAGFKTGNVDSITERLGGKKYRNFHRGGSDHVFG